MPTAPVRELDVYYETHGAGPPLLVISGTGNDLRYSAPHRMPVNEHFAATHYDQRGLGRTGRPPGPYSMADYADDAAALIDHLGTATTAVLGISFGGMVAQHVALRHPARVERLVLACTSAGGGGGSSADLLALAELPDAERARRSLALLDTRNDVDAGRLAPGLDVLIEQGIERQASVSTDADASRGARLQLEARAGHDVWDRLPEITAPTLVIGGHHDGIAPPDNQVALSSRIPGATLVWADGGHAFLLQDPA
ncbi:MAG: alpha/beta fold hydrolase, partial [Actinomycetota bacterium]